ACAPAGSRRLDGRRDLPTLRLSAAPRLAAKPKARVPKRATPSPSLRFETLRKPLPTLRTTSEFATVERRRAMLAKRVIPCMDVKDGRVVKGVNFVNLRDAGDPIELAQR